MSESSLLRMAAPVLGEREMANVEEAVRTGWISSQGRYVLEFEQRFSSYCGAAHGVAVSNGTTALHLAMAVLGVNPGDEVILPPITHIAAANAVRLAGGTVVLADCAEDTWGLDPAAVREKVTDRTKVILPVHLYGHPVDMEPLQALARERGIRLIEDAAEAHGAEAYGTRAGALGDIGCFSFYANKIITTGEGGMLVTSDPDLAARARRLRDHAYEPERRYWHRELGFNYRLTNMQAAVGAGQMDRIEEFVETRRRNARLYAQFLADVPGLTLQPEAPWARNVYWMYSVLVDPQTAGLTRDELGAELLNRGIESRPFFYPVHRQPLYEAQFVGQPFPVADRLGLTGLNLPSGNDLRDRDVERVATAVREIIGAHAGTGR